MIQLNKKSLLMSVMSLIIIFLSNFTYASWNVKINSEGENKKGLYKNFVIIGVDVDQQLKAAPPRPPIFSSLLRLIPYDWSSPLLKDIKSQDDNFIQWTLAVNPGGNIINSSQSKTILSWNPESFGDGHFELRQGWDGSGEVIISDMKKTTNLEVTGGNEDIYFTIIMREE